MANTRSLNSDDSVFVTTFFGGEDVGRCYTIKVSLDYYIASKTFTEKELFDLISREGTISVDDKVRPEFDK